MCGARVMDSWPPATTTVASPLRIIRAASITAVRPERQTLLMVTVGTFQPMPAPMALWRAGFWPGAGLQHLAHDHGVHLVGLHPAGGQGRADGVGASSTAVKLASWPFRRPCGVRAAARMTTSLLSAELLMIFSSDLLTMYA